MNSSTVFSICLQPVYSSGCFHINLLLLFIWSRDLQHIALSPDHLTNVTTTFVFTQGPQHWWIMRHIFRIVFVLAFLVCLHITMHPQPSCFQNSCFSDNESMRLLSCDSLADLHFGCDSIIMSPVFCWRMSHHRETTTLRLQMGISALGKHVRQHAGRESNFPA